MSKPETARILIVDDEAAQMKALRDSLGEKGYETAGFTSGQEALAAMKTRPFDLLLTDLMMPEVDGIALVRAALEKDGNLVCIMMTGAGTVATAVEAMKAGALDYILKPFKLSFILPVLHRALEVRRLRIENAALQKRVEAHIAELEEANKELEAFAHSASHDLRAPLRCIRGFAELLEKELKPGLSPSAEELLSRIAVSAKNMQELIDALLNLSRMGRHALCKEQVDVQTLVSEIVAGLQKEHSGRQIEVQIGELPGVSADPLLIKQVFLNVLSNAFKFTAKREKAHIEIGATQDGSETTYSVRDNGAGFDMRYAKNLFVVFQRLHSVKAFDGVGVGLSLAQRIVHRHGGRIWAEAEVDKGAAFFFSLPN